MLWHKNSRSFVDVCQGVFGRRMIMTSASEITEDNIVKEFGKAFSIHNQNRDEINYLDYYYRGNQPILYRQKEIRPQINNKIVENHAFEIVEHKVSEVFGEPIQYVLRGTEETKSQNIKRLNDYMDSEDKGYSDIELGRWRSICGTSYRFIWVDKQANKEYDEAPFGFEVLDPRFTFVVYSSAQGKRPMFSVQQVKDCDNTDKYCIYTKNRYFEIKKGKLVKVAVNGIGLIPVVEYPNNDRRLSDIEITITMLDTINKIQSNRSDGIEQFVQAFMKFINCDIDEDTFLEMCQLGAIKVKGQQGLQADVDLVSQELKQDQTQIYKNDIYDNILIIEGMPDRQENSGGDTGQAVVLRNGFYFSEKRAELNEPIFKKSEREFLRVVLKILNTKKTYNMDLKLSDIEIKITRSKTDNMQVKAQVLQMLLAAGINPERAIKICNLFSDPEEVCIESKETLKKWYQTEVKKIK